MSGFLSPKYLKYQRAWRTRKITHDHYCRCCGYNVRGLNYGRNCPECGEQIAVSGDSGGAGGPLLCTSREQRQRWRLGLALATLSLLVALVTPFALVIDLVFVGGLVMPMAYLTIGLVASAAWIAGVWLITPPDMAGPEAWRRKLRGAVRWSQWLWPVGYVCWMVAAGTPAGSAAQTLAYVASLACRGVAGAGALGLAVLLQPVAEAAELEDAARHLNAAVWLLPIPSVLLALTPIMPWSFIVLIAMLLLLPWGWFMWLYARSLLEMQRCVSWWLGHSAVSHTRTQRVTQARAAADEQLRASVRPAPPQEPDIPLEPGTGENVRGKTGGHAHGPHHRQ